MIGDDQPIAINDITLTSGGVTYGGYGSDTLVFDIPFAGAAYAPNGNVYTNLSTADEGPGFVLEGAPLPENGLVFRILQLLHLLQIS